MRWHCVVYRMCFDDLLVEKSHKKYFKYSHQSHKSSLGRYVFGSEITEISYNKPPPPPAWARLLNKPKSQKIVGH